MQDSPPKDGSGGRHGGFLQGLRGHSGVVRVAPGPVGGAPTPAALRRDPGGSARATGGNLHVLRGPDLVSDPTPMLRAWPGMSKTQPPTLSLRTLSESLCRDRSAGAAADTATDSGSTR
ncbi:unnamed protein product [Merluccius merluccius]